MGWTIPDATYVVGNDPQACKITGASDTAKGDITLSENWQGNHAVTATDVFHHEKEYDKHTGHGEQEDDSPVGPSIRRASPLQTQYQADGHGKFNCQPIPVQTFQPLSCT